MTWRRAALALVPLLASSAFSQQDDPDLGRVYGDEENEFKIRPPAGWMSLPGTGNYIVRFVSQDKIDPVPKFEVLHLIPKNPTTIPGFAAELRTYMKDQFPGNEVLIDKECTLAGRSAHVLAIKWTAKNGVASAIVRTVVARHHLDYYCFNFECPAGETEKYFKLHEKVIATFSIERAPLREEDRAADGRSKEFFKSARPVRADLLGETWLSIQLAQSRVGYQRMKLTEATIEGAKGYAFEEDVRLDFGEGGKDDITIRGTCSADFAAQRVDTEQTITTDKAQKLVFRASAVLSKGEIRVTRDLNGVKEEKEFKVGEGVLFTDFVDLFTRCLLDQPRGSYFARTFDPYSDETGTEFVENGGKGKVELKSKVEKEVYVVFSKRDRRVSKTIWYAPDKTLYVIRGPKSPFFVIACTKEEAMGEKKK